MRTRWKRLSLRARVFPILIVLVGIIFGGGATMIWYTYRMESLFTDLINRDMAALQVVEELAASLGDHKGLVTNFFLDGNPAWLRQMEKHRDSVKAQLGKARAFTATRADVETLEKIESEYNKYIEVKDQAMLLYLAGNKDGGAIVQREATELLANIVELCSHYKNAHYQRINATQSTSRQEAERLRIIAVTAMSAAGLLGLFLAVILMSQILRPLRELALETDRSSVSGARDKPDNEVVALSHQVRGLIKDMEKFALVGRLAAGIAHSIRNPLTSVKMRLFSLERGLSLSEVQKEDFQVVAQEIRHIDTIVQNFLEFSRPPKLKMQRVSPSDIVDNALQLLRDRLVSYGVEIKVNREIDRLPEVLADQEQLKEVLVNLIVNACEAMSTEGVIVIAENETIDERRGPVVSIRMSDSGPGIPKSIQEKVFQPFFSTKEEGTGLGLTIAARIVSEHGGWLDLTSREGKGATFIINLPLKKEHNE